MQESTVYRSIARDARKEEKRSLAKPPGTGIAINCLREGVSTDIIASCTALSIEEVQQLQQQMNESAQV